MRMRIGISIFCLPVIFIIAPALLSAESRERENLSRASRALDELAIPFEKRSLLADHGGFGYSLLVRAEDSHPGTFVLAVPLEADFAVDTGLALAEAMRGHGNPVNIIVAFLGNERNELPGELGGVPHKGLRDLLNIADIPENWVLCYLDIASAPQGLVLRHGSRGYVTPLEILRPLASLLSSHGIPWSFRIRFNEIYKLGFVEAHQALSIAWQEEVNGFVLTESPGFPGEPSAYAICPHGLAALFLDYAAALNFPMLKLDKHYFFLTVPGGEVLFFGEGITVALLLITVGICLFLFLVYSVKYNALLLFNTRLFFKSIWVFFILLFLMVVSIRAAGILYAALFLAFGPPGPAGLPAHAYYAGAGLTMLLAILIFFLHSPVFSLIRIPKRAQFYGFSSVILVAMGLLTAAFLDISFVPAFLWASFFIFFAASLSRPALVFPCILLIPLLALAALLNIIETGSTRIAELFISPNLRSPGGWLFAVQIALFSLPLFLLVKRGIILCRKASRREHKPRGRFRLAAVSMLLAVILAAMLAQILLIPGDQIAAPERRFIAEGPDIAPGTENEILMLSLENVVFQDTRIITLNLGARGSPVRFDVSLECAYGLSLPPVYSAPVPFRRERGGSRVQFILGENPPNPLSLEIALPWNFAGFLRAQALFNAWDPALDPGEEPGTGDYILRVSRTVDLGQ